MKQAVQPKYVIFTFTLLCLIAFWITIPLPRVDGQLVGSDGTNYFAYLPSVILDHDLDFRNQLEILLASSPDELALRVAGRPDDQPIGNPHGIGLAILWAPFYLLALVLAKIISVAGIAITQDGQSHFYQAIVLSGSIIFGGLGLWFTYLFVRRFSSTHSALVATLLIAAAGNVIYYMTAEPSMSHNASLFLSAAFFLGWAHYRDDSRLRIAALYGLLGGALALVRPQDGLLLALPYLAMTPSVWLKARQGDYAAAWRWIRNGIIAASVAFLVFSLQLFAWNIMFGSPFHNPYSNAGEFAWLQPKIGQALFSSRRGLFVWHPIFLVALAGLLCTYRIDRTFALTGFLGCVMQLYLISSWSWWWQGSAFGSRMMIVCTPIFVLGLASLQDCIASRWSWKPVYGFAALLLLWNFLLFVEYRFWLVYAEMANPATWYDLTVRRVTFILDKVY